MFKRIAFCLVVVLGLSSVVNAAIADMEDDFRVYWDDGIRFQSGDEEFKMKIGGRVHYDLAWFDEDEGIEQQIGEQGDSSEFRRARISAAGSFTEELEFNLQLDFAGGGKVAFRDAYISLPNFPLGRLTAGQFKEPFSLNELTSSNSIIFIERALPMVFAPSRSVGIMLSNSAFEEKMTWAAGVFRETDSRARSLADNGFGVTGRVTFAPVYEGEGAEVVHFGAAYTYRQPEDDSIRFRARPEANLADRFVDTGSIDSDEFGVLGLEAAWVHGPLSVQGEYMRTGVNGSNGQVDLNFDGYYVQGSYWLTGERRNYNRSSGTFGSVKPKRNFGQDGGLGAWEVAARYSYLNLRDEDVDGGKLDTITAGLNWYLNPNARVMFNYIYADRDRIGSADIYLMRLQVNF